MCLAKLDFILCISTVLFLCIHLRRKSVQKFSMGLYIAYSNVFEICIYLKSCSSTAHFCFYVHNWYYIDQIVWIILLLILTLQSLCCSSSLLLMLLCNFIDYNEFQSQLPFSLYFPPSPLPFYCACEGSNQLSFILQSLSHRRHFLQDRLQGHLSNGMRMKVIFHFQTK